MLNLPLMKQFQNFFVRPFSNNIRTQLFKAVKKGIELHGCVYVDHPTFTHGKMKGAPIRIITDVTYKKSTQEEVYSVSNPYTHERFTLSFSKDEVPKIALLNNLEYGGYSVMTTAVVATATAYAKAAMEVKRSTKLVVGSLINGDILALYSGSRPCASPRLSDGNIINFSVMDKDTFEFKKIVHWDFTKGYLWGAKMLPISKGKLIPYNHSHQKVGTGHYLEWKKRTSQQVKIDHPFLVSTWGDHITPSLKIGDLISTPRGVGLLIGECTGEDRIQVLVVLEPCDTTKADYKYGNYLEVEVTPFPEIVDLSTLEV